MTQLILIETMLMRMEINRLMPLIALNWNTKLGYCVSAVKMNSCGRV